MPFLATMQAAGHRRRCLCLPTIYLSGAGRRPDGARRDARMSFQVDVWLRSSDAATTRTVDGVAHAPASWDDDDVRQVLEGMLRAIHQLKHPTEIAPPVALRGISWIVNTYEEGGVVIAIEITLGAAVAGPFDIDKTTLEGDDHARHPSADRAHAYLADDDPLADRRYDDPSSGSRLFAVERWKSERPFIGKRSAQTGGHHPHAGRHAGPFRRLGLGLRRASGDRDTRRAVARFRSAARRAGGAQGIASRSGPEAWLRGRGLRRCRRRRDVGGRRARGRSHDRVLAFRQPAPVLEFEHCEPRSLLRRRSVHHRRHHLPVSHADDVGRSRAKGQGLALHPSSGRRHPSAAARDHERRSWWELLPGGVLCEGARGRRPRQLRAKPPRRVGLERDCDAHEGPSSGGRAGAGRLPCSAGSATEDGGRRSRRRRRP